jgi:23S rRNA (pseudouridine1915-N3)-methyltransferase
MLGKMRRAECRALFEDYIARMRHYTEIEVVELRDGSPAATKKLRLDSATLILLDAGGRLFTSEQLARWLGGLRDRGTRDLVFLCGNAQGFPEELQKRAQMKLSLTTLTLQHELARAVLAEQIYRAFTILAGHPYNK